MKRKHKRLMAYFYMPLIFLIIGYSLLYIAFRPVIDLSMSMAGMFMTQESPTFGGNFESILDDESEEEDPNENRVISRSDVSSPNIGTHYGELISEDFDLNVPVYYGDNDRILTLGAGHYTGTYMPGFGKPILVSGHNRTVFAPLEHAEVGDQVTYRTHYGTFVYEIREIEIYHHTDRSAYDLRQEKEELILYTCWDFTPISGRKHERIFFYLDKISGPEVE